MAWWLARWLGKSAAALKHIGHDVAQQPLLTQSTRFLDRPPTFNLLDQISFSSFPLSLLDDPPQVPMGKLGNVVYQHSAKANTHHTCPQVYTCTLV